MDAASQLQHYSTLHTRPAPGTDPLSPPEALAKGDSTPQPVMPPQGNPLNHHAPSTTLSEGSWPTPPVVSTSTPPPIPPVEPFDAQDKPTTHTQLTNNSHHFPFMIVTMLVLIALVGFGGSFLYFKAKGATTGVIPKPAITQPVTVTPSQIVANPTTLPPQANPFAQGGATVSANPFATEDEGNPFDNVTGSESATQAGYTNPFDTSK